MVVSYVALKPDKLVFYNGSDHNEDANHLASINYIGTTGQIVLRGSAGAAAARLTGIASPQAPTDAISAGYATWKTAVRFASTDPLDVLSSDIVLTANASGALVLDGSAPEVDDRVLLKDQTDTSQNGIYVVTATGGESAAFVLTRSHDFRDGCNVLGAAVAVRQGTAHALKVFVASSTDASVTVGISSISFSPITTDVSAAAISGNQIVADTIPLEKLSAVDTDEGGRLVYFLRTEPAGEGHGSAQSLVLGTTGWPLVAGALNPEYAQLTGDGILDGTIAGDKLATGVYKDELSIGNNDAQEYITFGSVASGTPGVQIHVDGEVRVSATAAGGSFVGTWSSSSDDKWKELLGPVSADPLADLDKVQSESWTWKPGFQFQAGAFSAGVVAQQFQLVCPRAVTFSAEQGGLVVDYNAVHSFSLACIKALKLENEARKVEFAGLRQVNAELREANAALGEANAALGEANAALGEANTASLAADAAREARVHVLELQCSKMEATVGDFRQRLDGLELSQLCL